MRHGLMLSAALLGGLALSEWRIDVNSREAADRALAAHAAMWTRLEDAAKCNVIVSGHCSGVLLQRGDIQYVLTASHCVDDDDVIVVEMVDADGKTHSAQAIILAVDGAQLDHDLCLLELLDPLPVRPEIRLYDGRSPPRGSEMFHLGNPLSLSYSFIRGHLAYIDRELGHLGKFDQVSLNGGPGSSGGGVYNADGELCGVIVRGGPPSFMFMIPARNVRLWLDSVGFGDIL